MIDNEGLHLSLDSWRSLSGVDDQNTVWFPVQNYVSSVKCRDSVTETDAKCHRAAVIVVVYLAPVHEKVSLTSIPSGSCSTFPDPLDHST